MQTFYNKNYHWSLNYASDVNVLKTWNTILVCWDLSSDMILTNRSVKTSARVGQGKWTHENFAWGPIY